MGLKNVFFVASLAKKVQAANKKSLMDEITSYDISSEQIKQSVLFFHTPIIIMCSFL